MRWVFFGVMVASSLATAAEWPALAFPDTADLLGWYILPITWGAESDVVAKGNAKELSYAHEWVNPRFGKPVNEVRLGRTSGFRNTRDRPTGDNAIVPAAISVVKKRLPPAAGVAER